MLQSTVSTELVIGSWLLPLAGGNGALFWTCWEAPHFGEQGITDSFPASFGLRRGNLVKRRVLAQCQLSIVWHSCRHRQRIFDSYS